MKHGQLVDIVEAAHRSAPETAPEVAALHVIDPVRETLEFLAFLETVRDEFPENNPAVALPVGYRSTWLW